MTGSTAQQSVAAPATPRQLLPALALAALVAVVLGRALGFPFVFWDDPQYISENPLVDPAQAWPADGILTARLGYPIPVTVGVYRLVAWVGGLDARAFHALNLALHLANALLFLRLLRASGLGWTALLGAALWAVHPLNVEPVTWCTGTKDLLYGMGVLLVLNGALGVRRLSPWLLLVMLAAMLAKPTAIVLPVLLAWSLWRLQRDRLGERGSQFTLVLGALFALLVFAAGWAIAQHAGPDGYRTVDETPAGLRERLAAILQALDLQARHLLWPRGLSPQYFRLTDLRPDDPEFLRGAGWLLALGALAVWSLRQQDRRLGWWLGIGLIAYAPVSMLLPIQRFTCDSYAYVPLLAVFGWLATWLDGRRGPAAKPAPTPPPAVLPPAPLPRPAGALAAALVVLLSAGAWAQQSLWQDSLTLWGGALAADPQRPLLIKRYAETLDRLKRRPEAYQFLRPRLALLQRERLVDGMVLAVYSEAAPQADARALYAWAYAHEPDLRPDAHRNFCTFLATHRLQPDAVERRNLARALDVLRRFHGRRGEVDALVALGGLAGDNQLWLPAGELLEQAFLASRDARHGQMALVAYREAARTEPQAAAAAQRVQQALAAAAPAR